jgi:hypothetical protein
MVYIRTVSHGLSRSRIKQDSFFYTLRFLHFSDNKNEFHKTDENYDRLSKITIIFEQEIAGSHSSKHEDDCLLGCCTIVGWQKFTDISDVLGASPSGQIRN